MISTLIDRKRPRVRITENGVTRRLDLFEALVNVRNRFAHSRVITPDTAAALFDDHIAAWTAVVGRLAAVFEARVLTADPAGAAYLPLDGRDFAADAVTPPGAVE